MSTVYKIYNVTGINKFKTYKAFDGNLKCKGLQFEIGKIYNENEIKIGEKGIHSCIIAKNCNQYYPHNNYTRYAECEVWGYIEEITNDKLCSTFISIVREISTLEWEILTNKAQVNSKNQLHCTTGPARYTSIYYLTSNGYNYRKDYAEYYLDGILYASDQWPKWKYNKGYAKYKIKADYLNSNSN